MKPNILFCNKDSHICLFINQKDILGIVPFVTSHLMRRFFVFFTVDFLLCLAPAGGSNPVGQSLTFT